jgi:hypothetical protein
LKSSSCSAEDIVKIQQHLSAIEASNGDEEVGDSDRQITMGKGHKSVAPEFQASTPRPDEAGVGLQQALGNRTALALFGRLRLQTAVAGPDDATSLLRHALGNRATLALFGELQTEDADLEPAADRPAWSGSETFRVPGGARLLEGKIVAPAITIERVDSRTATFLEDLEVVEPAVEKIVAALAPVVGSDQAQNVWSAVVSQVEKPVTTVASDGKAIPAVYDNVVVDAIKALGRLPPGVKAGPGLDPAIIILRRKVLVLGQVFSSLLSTREASLRSADAGEDDAASADLDAELKGVLRNVQPFIGNEGSLAEYRRVRPALLAEFGALTVGTVAALERARDYYRQIVTAYFLDHRVLVHALMEKQLTEAEKALTLPERVALKPAIVDISGINIRPNANSPLRLSPHSFGAAVDINAAMSPNVPNFPTQFVQQLTDVNVMVDRAGEKKDNILDLGPAPYARGARTSGTAVEVQPEAERLHQASQTFSAIFADEGTLAAKLLELARARAHPPDDLGAVELLQLVKDASDEGPNVRWRVPVVPGLEITMGQRRLRTGGATPRGLKHEMLVRRLSPPRQGFYNPEPTLETVDLFFRMLSVFEETFEHDRAGDRKVVAGKEQRIAPAARPSKVGGIAYHGFLSIPERLISVLAGRDAGNLRWLGGLERGLKDSMHFELRSTPKRY